MDVTDYFTNLRDDPLHWFLITAITGSEHEVDKFIPDGNTHDAKLIINGVEANLVHAVKRFVENIDESVEKRAKELLEEKLNDQYDKLTDAVDGFCKDILK